MSDAKLILASASPRRRQLLEQISVPFSVLAMDIDESVIAGESATDYVTRMAREKAAVAMGRRDLNGASLVLAADTIVLVGESILGKPDDARSTAAMLALLSDRSHRVLTAVTLSDGDASRSVLSVSTVTFRAITPAEAARYWETGEPRGKAGAYAIQGLGAVFVKSLHGSYSGVMGLPLFETAGLLAEFGFSPWRNTGETDK